ncbi:MAG: hypothetical protein QXQ60_07905 [Thermofilum sp.]
MRPEVLASAEEVERGAELNRRAFEKLREELVRGREACTRLSLGVSSSEFSPLLKRRQRLSRGWVPGGGLPSGSPGGGELGWSWVGA